MLTHEEALLAAHSLYNAGYKHTYIWGDNQHGYHVRASKFPPLSPPSYKEPWVQVDEPEELKKYLPKR